MAINPNRSRRTERVLYEEPKKNKVYDPSKDYLDIDYIDIKDTKKISL